MKKKLGTTGLEISPLVFGGNVFGWTANEATSFKLLDEFVAAGFNTVDTADVYSSWVPGHMGGESETIIGKWMKLRGNRARMIIATKVGMKIAPDKQGLKKTYIMAEVEDSLRRLQTDYIDLYQSHVDDPDTPQDETLEAYSRLIAAGKVRAIGASNFTAERLSLALKTSRDRGVSAYGSLQPLYNLYDREGFEKDLVPLCVRENIGVITYASLAGGFLTGKYRSEADLTKSPRGVRAQKRLNARGLRILAALDDVAARLNSTPAAVGLAWLLTRPAVTAPIASATSLDQLNDLIASTTLRLAEEDLDLLNTASAP